MAEQTEPTQTKPRAQSTGGAAAGNRGEGSPSLQGERGSTTIAD